MDPVLVPPKRAGAKHAIYEFEGVRFYPRPPSGYYQSGNEHGDRYLHRVVWARAHGPIPEGHHIHHRDGNPANNRLENLECLLGTEHSRAHMLEPHRVAHSRRAIRRAIVGAVEWRKRNPDAAREIGLRGIAGLRKAEARAGHVEKQCQRCSKTYAIHEFHAPSSKFCSPSCQTAFRVASGVDDIDASCASCGGSFRTNRYKSRKTCSPACKGALISRYRSQPRSL